MNAVKMNAVKMNRGDAFVFVSALCRSPRLVQFVKFCLVGGSGVVVDMAVLFLLADPRCLGLGITLSKILAAETALANNFLWNEFWTFRPPRCLIPAPDSALHAPCSTLPAPSSLLPAPSSKLRRFLLFNAICGIGIGLAVLLLHLFHSWLGLNLYLSNLLAIILVTLWNFGMNATLTWNSKTVKDT